MGVGIWNFILNEFFWKNGVKDIEDDEEREYMLSNGVSNFIRSVGLLYIGVGYFGYLKDYKYSYYFGAFSAVLCIGVGVPRIIIGRKYDFNYYVAWTDIVKGLGFAMMLYNVPLK